MRQMNTIEMTMSSSKTAGVRNRPTKAGIDRWEASIWVDGKTISLGTYDTEDEAIQARRAGEDKYRPAKTPTQTELRAAADYEAFVYLWYDSNDRKYYLGSHAGSTEELYTHSCKNIPRFDINSIPKGWRRRILARGTEQAMRDLETQLLVNRKSRCWDRYYNVNAHSSAIRTDNIDVSILHEALIYNADTGIFVWKTRPVDHFKTVRSQKICNTRYAGKQAGSNTSDGYIQLMLFKKNYKAHRLAWAMHYGIWPTDRIDHIDPRNKLDNRIVNLREATASENAKNKRMPINNTSGYIGVGKRGDKWYAYIKVDDKQIYLGTFDTKDEAIQARKQAEKLYGFHENHGS